MPLYRCRLSVEIVVYSAHETEPPGDFDVIREAEEEINDCGATLDVESIERITSSVDIPLEWGGCIPRGDDANDRSCERILADEGNG
jgi:hypothetical protein